MKCLYIVLFFALIACKKCKDPDAFVTLPNEEIKEIEKDTLQQVKKDTIVIADKKLIDLENLADTTFVKLDDVSKDFVYDLKYATNDNFLKKAVYDCAQCYLRVKTAKALLKANKVFMDKGVRIKFYDCYRPLDVQKKLWKIVPNTQYVAHPKKGSVHNRGGAVDITLVDLKGKELDMGTTFDFFGRKAYHDYFEHPGHILKNRKLLKETMEKYGFKSIRTEWWHYNLATAFNDKVANFKWNCE